MNYIEKHNFTKAELIAILDACIDKTLGEVDKNHVFERTKTMPKIIKQGVERMIAFLNNLTSFFR